MFVTSYFIVALVCGLIGYALAERQGRNALGWGWLCFLLVIPILVLLVAQKKQSSAQPARTPDATWQSLVTYDPDLRAAAERLGPLGEQAIDRLRTAYTAVCNKAALPLIVADIEKRSADQQALSLKLVETFRGVEIMVAPDKTYHVEGRRTIDLKTARALAGAHARGRRA